MEQPMLGKTIAELRKAKGLTQEELVERCKLNVRTLQRIEAGEVTPRSYTIKMIFAALDAEHHVFADTAYKPAGERADRSGRLEQVYTYVIDLFNLRTNTMKKISILSVMLIGVTFTLTTVFSDTRAQQSQADAKKTIDTKNKQYMQWFNAGNLDSLMTVYTADACVVSQGCGHDFIRAYYGEMMAGFEFQELRATDVTVTDGVVVETGTFAIKMRSTGQVIRGEYLGEWKRIDNKWFIYKEISNVGPNQGAASR